MPGEQPAVAADDLSIEYPASHGSPRFAAVRGVTVTVPLGELLGVVGESGSGKSTLARTIAGRGGHGGGLPAVAGGSLSVLGSDVRRLGERARRRLTAHVGYLPQNASRTLDQARTVAENVAAPIFERDRDFDRRDAGARAAELIDAVQLPLSMLAKYPYELSNGQRQRVAVARSLVLGPRVWVADEPMAGVDVTVREPVLDTVLAMQRSRPFSAIIISHDAAVMTRVTDRVAVLHRGVLVGLGPIDDVLASPLHPYVAGLARDYQVRTGPIRVLDARA